MGKTRLHVSADKTMSRVHESTHSAKEGPAAYPELINTFSINHTLTETPIRHIRTTLKPNTTPGQIYK